MYTCNINEYNELVYIGHHRIDTQHVTVAGKPRKPVILSKINMKHSANYCHLQISLCYSTDNARFGFVALNVKGGFCWDTNARVRKTVPRF